MGPAKPAIADQGPPQRPAVRPIEQKETLQEQQPVKPARPTVGPAVKGDKGGPPQRPAKGPVVEPAKPVVADKPPQRPAVGPAVKAEENKVPQRSAVGPAVKPVVADKPPVKPKPKPPKPGANPNPAKLKIKPPVPPKPAKEEKRESGYFSSSPEGSRVAKILRKFEVKHHHGITESPSQTPNNKPSPPKRYK